MLAGHIRLHYDVHFAHVPTKLWSRLPVKKCLMFSGKTEKDQHQEEGGTKTRR
jgi:hypothetical protein